jgi:hypothetical protein
MATKESEIANLFNYFILGEVSGSDGGEYKDVLCSGMLHRVVWQKFTDVSEVLAASIRTGGSKHT